MTDQQPNILFLVWDACRFDYAARHADTLQSLASRNYWFDNAVTPSPWSLPAHASMFTGEYPHDHGITRLGDSMESTSLVDELGTDGYRCYGVSANGFACQRTGFHAGFDEYYYTRGRERYPDGLPIEGYLLAKRYNSEKRIEPFSNTITAALTHEHPFKSLANILSVGVGFLGVRSDTLQKIPHPLLTSDSGYCYTPDANTRRLIEIIEREQHTDSPFFAFANYMDTHRPYKPKDDVQRTKLGRTIERTELERLNDDVADPWKFLAADTQDSIHDDDIETIQRLYAGEVTTVDEHLRKLLTALANTDQRDDTLIVVTSDHGENLGERTELGRRRMGHEASISDALARVPLVVAHPAINNGRVIQKPCSLTNLYDLFCNFTDHTEGSTIIDTLCPTEPVACEYPPAGGEQLFEKHPGVPREVLEYRISEHSVAVYSDTWRIVVESTGETYAWRNDESVPAEDAPDEILSAANDRLQLMRHGRAASNELSDSDVSHLEALGYL